MRWPQVRETSRLFDVVDGAAREVEIARVPLLTITRMLMMTRMMKTTTMMMLMLLLMMVVVATWCQRRMRAERRRPYPALDRRPPTLRSSPSHWSATMEPFYQFLCDQSSLTLMSISSAWTVRSAENTVERAADGALAAARGRIQPLIRVWTMQQSSSVKTLATM